MWVQPVDYLRILEGGYFLHFVAMAVVPADMISLVTTSGFRFKVIIDCFQFQNEDVEHVKTIIYIHYWLYIPYIGMTIAIWTSAWRVPGI